MMVSPSLKGRSASRYSCACDESAATSSVMRPASGGEVGFAGSGSGFSRVRARATLQVFAPRSRARGKCRLISCGGRMRQSADLCSDSFRSWDIL